MIYVHVIGDCHESIKSMSSLSLLVLVVEGFMPSRLLEAIQAVGYSHFQASIQKSDRPPGIYPDQAIWHKLHEKGRINRWVIHEQQG